MSQFAKIFNLPNGAQVLLIKGDPDDQVGEERLILITEIDGYRCHMRITHQTEHNVNAAFDRYKEEDAQVFYDNMIDSIR